MPSAHPTVSSAPGMAAPRRAAEFALPHGNGAPEVRAMRTGLVALALLAAASMLLRPPIPLDETRYLSVAWEMHRSGSWLVPRLDGAPYSHKPPLLFWLIRAGWALFGANAWWPRAIPAIAALLSVVATARLGRKLAARSGMQDPLDARAGARAGAVLAGSPVVAIYSTLLLFDLLVVLWVLVGIHAIVDHERRPARSLALFAAAIAAGILTKGPVVLLYLAPAALAFPSGRPLRRCAGALLGLALGAGAALCWAVPAARAGGEQYAQAILWGQTAGRVRSSFAHQEPFWWYLPIAPLLLLPWSLWPAWWRSAVPRSREARWLLVSALVPLVLLSFVSGKQPHYLLPVLPLPIVASALALRGLDRMRHFVWITPLVALIGLTTLWTMQSERFDLRAAAERLHALQEEGRPTAFVGGGHGQLTFLGRLREPPTPVEADALRAWCENHPEGAVALREDALAETGAWTETLLASAWLVQPYRGERLAIVPARAVLEATEEEAR